MWRYATAAPRTGMFIEDMRKTYGGADDHDPINFEPIATLHDPVHIAGEPGDRVYSLQVLLTQCNGKNPCTRAPLNPAAFEPLVATSLLRRHFIKTIRTLVRAGWTDIEQVERDMAQLPARRKLGENRLRSNDWPKVAEEYARAFSERTVPERELIIVRRIFRCDGFERIEAIRNLILRPLYARRSPMYRAQRDLVLLEFYNETDLTLRHIYHPNLLNHEQRRVCDAAPQDNDVGHQITIDTLATRFVLMRCRLYRQYKNVLMECEATVDDFQFIAEQLESTRDAAQDRAALRALLDARMVKEYIHPTSYVINPMTPAQVMLYGLAYASPELETGMCKSISAWVVYLLCTLQKHRQYYPSYSSGCLKRALPMLDKLGIQVFARSGDDHLVLLADFEAKDNQHICMEQLDALEANDLDAPDVYGTKYEGVARDCDEREEPGLFRLDALGLGEL